MNATCAKTSQLTVNHLNQIFSYRISVFVEPFKAILHNASARVLSRPIRSRQHIPCLYTRWRHHSWLCAPVSYRGALFAR